jgi:hypothetical protein
MQEVSEHQVPERVIITIHGHPEYKADCARTTQAVEVLRGESLWILILSQVDQLWNQCDCLYVHSEGDKHLLGYEVFSFASWMEDK